MDALGRNMAGMFQEFHRQAAAQPPKRAEALDQSLVGKAVCLQGLRATEYNGRVGVVQSLFTPPQNTSGSPRYIVRLEGASTELKRFRPANVRPAVGLELMTPLEALEAAALLKRYDEVCAAIHRAELVGVDPTTPAMAAAVRNRGELKFALDSARSRLSECPVEAPVDPSARTAAIQLLTPAVAAGVRAGIPPPELAPPRTVLRDCLQLSLQTAADEGDADGLEAGITAARAVVQLIGPSLAKPLEKDVAICELRATELRRALELAAIRRARCLPEDLVVPDHFLCPITLERMRDPVVAADGFSYERGAIERCLAVAAEHLTPANSPKTGKPLPSTALVPNETLRQLIRGFDEETHAQLVSVADAIEAAREKQGGAVQDRTEPAEATHCSVAVEEAGADGSYRVQPVVLTEAEEDHHAKMQDVGVQAAALVVEEDNCGDPAHRQDAGVQVTSPEAKDGAATGGARVDTRAVEADAETLAKMQLELEKALARVAELEDDVVKATNSAKATASAKSTAPTKERTAVKATTSAARGVIRTFAVPVRRTSYV